MQCPICENSGAADVTLTTFDGRMMRCPECGGLRHIWHAASAANSSKSANKRSDSSPSKSETEDEAGDAADGAYLRPLKHQALRRCLAPLPCQSPNQLSQLGVECQVGRPTPLGPLGLSLPNA
jgi:hypothetical protein